MVSAKEGTAYDVNAISATATAITIFFMSSSFFRIINANARYLFKPKAPFMNET
jgi:hypothetical protein